MTLEDIAMIVIGAAILGLAALAIVTNNKRMNLIERSRPAKSAADSTPQDVPEGKD